mgnify:FL=1
MLQSRREQLEVMRRDPIIFFKLCWPEAIVWEKLQEIAQSVVDHKRTIVRSGHGVGKSWLMARLVIWFLTVYKPSKVITTAPIWSQVEKILWKEIRQAHHASRWSLAGELLQTEWKIDEDCFAVGISTNERVDQREYGATQMQGYHSPNMLFILDEAAGVPAEIWTASTSLLTSDNNKIIAIGNPASPTGPFFDAFKSPIWNKIHISCAEHPNVREGKTIIPGCVTKDWIEERKTEWGEDSPLFKAKVLGEFPVEGADTLISLSWIERAVDNPLAVKDGNIRLGCDVARYGEDETVLYQREGLCFDLCEVTNKKSTTDTSGRVIASYERLEASVVAVDDTGVGGGVTDMVKEKGLHVEAINFGSAAIDSERFANLKAEMYWLLREEFEKNTISIPNDPILINQLASIKYGYTSRGQIKIESKDDMKKRGQKSPDRADALAICYIAGRRVKIPQILFV